MRHVRRALPRKGDRKPARKSVANVHPLYALRKNMPGKRKDIRENLADRRQGAPVNGIADRTWRGEAGGVLLKGRKKLALRGSFQMTR
jgi:hypothetical protein